MSEPEEDGLEIARMDLLSGDGERIRSAVTDIERLASGGDAIAKYAVATWILNETHGYERDFDRAERLLSFSANNLVPEALYDLAALIENERRGAGYRKRAFSLYVVAAILGDMDALLAVERCLYWGIGAFRNREASKLVGKIIERKKR